MAAHHAIAVRCPPVALAGLPLPNKRRSSADFLEKSNLLDLMHESLTINRQARARKGGAVAAD